ncbi:MAG: hypothetical protein ACRCZI_02990 [Cetobacterium sp.]
MHYGLHITRLAFDRWKLELKYKHGSFSETFSTFHEALDKGRDYVFEDEAHERGDVEATLLEILGQVVEGS